MRTSAMKFFMLAMITMALAVAPVIKAYAAGGDNPLGAVRQIGGCAVVVGAVGDLVAQDALGLAVVAFGSGDRGQIQSGDLLVRGCQ